MSVRKEGDEGEGGGGGKETATTESDKRDRHEERKRGKKKEGGGEGKKGKGKEEGGAGEKKDGLKDGELTIEPKSDFSSTTQTYSLLPGEPRRLEVITKVQSSGPMGGSTIQLKRVFDPETGDAPSPPPT